MKNARLKKLSFHILDFTVMVFIFYILGKSLSSLGAAILISAVLYRLVTRPLLKMVFKVEQK